MILFLNPDPNQGLESVSSTLTGAGLRQHLLTAESTFTPLCRHYNYHPDPQEAEAGGLSSRSAGLLSETLSQNKELPTVMSH